MIQSIDRLNGGLLINNPKDRRTGCNPCAIISNRFEQSKKKSIHSGEVGGTNKLWRRNVVDIGIGGKKEIEYTRICPLKQLVKCILMIPVVDLYSRFPFSLFLSSIFSLFSLYLSFPLLPFFSSLLSLSPSYIKTLPLWGSWRFLSAVGWTLTWILLITFCILQMWFSAKTGYITLSSQVI